MLCPKCKTAVSETDTQCKYCGAKLSGGKNKLWIAAAVVVVVGVGAYMFFKPQGDKPGTEPGPVAVGSETPVPTASQTGVEPSPSAEPLQTPANIPGSEGYSQPTMEPQPSYTPNFEKSTEEVIQLVDDVAIAAGEFYDQFLPYGVYVSRNGFFFEQQSDSYIKTETLAETTSIAPEVAKESVFILYIRPDDLVEYKSLSIKPSDKLEVFAAYETKEGFLIASRNNAGGVLPREDLQKVLNKYSYEHGVVRKVEKDSEDHNQIMKALSAAIQSGAEMDVRYLFRDDKYAVAVVSPVGRTGQINEYVLQNISGQWSVVTFNFEAFNKFQAALNSQLVDLNLDMVPKYDMTVTGKYIRSDFSDIIRSMKISSYITDADGDATFQSGTDDFIYMEFKSGKKFVGLLNSDGVWQMYQITTYEDAVKLMRTVSNNPPLFIIKQY